MDPPPDKKRRTTDGSSLNGAAAGEDNLWDDDDDDLLLTQENIDKLMQSQVIGPVGDGESGDTRDMIHDKHPTSARTIGRGSVKSKSYTSGGSHRPSHLGDSKNIVSQATNATSCVRSASVSDSSDINRLKAENNRLQKELKEIQMITQGRIKILQDKLAQREADIEKVRQDKLEQLAQATRDQSNREKYWQKELDKLKSELQFTKHELEVETEKHINSRRQHDHLKASPTTSRSNNNLGYDFSADFISKQKSSTPNKPKKDAILQVSLSLVSDKASIPEHKLKLNLKKTKGHISSSHLVQKVIQLQLPISSSSQKPSCTGVTANETKNRNDHQSDQTSMETITSRYLVKWQSDTKPSYMSTDSSALSGACAHLQETSSLLMRTVSCLSQGKPSSAPEGRLLHSDTDSAILLLPTIMDSINTYTSVLMSFQFSATSQSGSISSTTDGSPSVDALASNESSLPRGISARFIQVMGHQMQTVLCVLKTLVMYSEPVCEMLIQQVCGDSVTDQSQRGVILENNGAKHGECCLLKRLCHLANYKLLDNLGSNLQLCVLSLEILALTMQHCSASNLKRMFDSLPISDAILAGISEDVEGAVNRFQFGYGVLQLVHTLTRSDRVVRMMCTKNADCIFYNVYSFCVQSLNDQPEDKYLLQEAKFLQILASVLTHDRSTSSVLTSVDCHCGEVASQLLSVLHHIYVSGIYHDNGRALTLLHQGASIFQNLTALDKEFVQSHENNPQYVELVYGMDSLYKTLLEGREPVSQDLLLELRQECSGDEEEDMDKGHESNQEQPNSATAGGSRVRTSDVEMCMSDPECHSTPKECTAEPEATAAERDSAAHNRQRKRLKLGSNK